MEEDLEFLPRSLFGGYGKGGYELDCYSALGLLGLLGLLEILRDIVEDITTQRKRRSSSTFGRSFGQFSNNFGQAFGGTFGHTFGHALRHHIPADIFSTFPAVVMPLLHVVADVNDDQLPPSCLELSFCEANRALLLHPHSSSSSSSSSNSSSTSSLSSSTSTNNPPPGAAEDGFFSLKSDTRWKVAQLLSEVIAKAFVVHVGVGEDDVAVEQAGVAATRVLRKVMGAAAFGRTGGHCEDTFGSACLLQHKYKIQLGVMNHIYS